MSVKVSIFICFYGYEKNDCHFYICVPYFKVWNFRWNIVSRNLYRVSVVIFAGPSFCSLCQNLRKPQKLFQFPQGMCFSLISFLILFRLPKITRVKTHLKSRLKNEVAHHCYQMKWWRKLFLWWKLCAWKVLRYLIKPSVGS